MTMRDRECDRWRTTGQHIDDFERLTWEQAVCRPEPTQADEDRFTGNLPQVTIVPVEVNDDDIPF